MYTQVYHISFSKEILTHHTHQPLKTFLVAQHLATPSLTARKLSAVSFSHCEQVGNAQKLLKVKHAWETEQNQPIASMGLVCLPTWMVEIYGKCIGKYTIHPYMDHMGNKINEFVKKIKTCS